MITKDKIRAIRVDMDKALEDVAKRHGLKKLKCGNGTFSGSNFTLKVEGILEGGISKEAQYYNDCKGFMNLPDLGTPFITGAKVYKTIGLNSRGTKILCERADGKVFLFVPESVSLYTGMKSVAPMLTDTDWPNGVRNCGR